jgi:hypothetical protein
MEMSAVFRHPCEAITTPSRAGLDGDLRGGIAAPQSCYGVGWIGGSRVAHMDQVSIYLPGIILAYSVFLLAIMSPGPNVLAVIGTSMSVGRNAGIALALGVAAGSFGWAFLAAVGLSALLASYAHALTAIKIAGGVYLLWLAYKAFRSAASAHDIEVASCPGRVAARLAISPAASRSR